MSSDKVKLGLISFRIEVSGFLGDGVESARQNEQEFFAGNDTNVPRAGNSHVTLLHPACKP